MATVVTEAGLEVPAHVLEAQKLLTEAKPVIYTRGANIAPAALSALPALPERPGEGVTGPVTPTTAPLAVPNIIRRRFTSDDDVKHGPPQLPIEEQKGEYMSRELWDNYKRDSLGRDTFSTEARIREWEETEELYHRHKDAPIPVDTDVLRLPKYGIHLLGGEMGQGKTLVCAWIARHFRRRGWNVFSTAGPAVRPAVQAGRGLRLP